MDTLYKRVILKISGESLANEKDFSILDAKKINSIVSVVKKLQEKNVEVGIVIGAGNIFRGARLSNQVGIDQKVGDYMGMLGTVINCMAVANVLEKNDIKVYLSSALAIEKVTEKYNARKAKRLMKNHVILFAAGTGNPFCTTDTCASLRACEMDCDAILAGKQGVDGVYTDDPKKNKKAKFIKELTYNDVIENDLKVIDKSAAKMLIDKKIEFRIFAVDDLNNFIKIVEGQDIGTIIKEK